MPERVSAAGRSGLDHEPEVESVGMKEQISVLVDGESSSSEREKILRAMHADPELRDTWERYHLVSTAIRRELGVVLRSGLADRVQARLHSESPEPVLRHRPYFKFAAGLAIAASVATIAIFSLSPVQQPSRTPLAKASPVGASRTTVADSRQLPDEQQRALGPYLVPHGEFARTTGMLSYVRVVGYEDTAAVDAPAAAADGKNGE